MKCCALLFHALNVEPHALQPCCDTQSVSIPSFPFHGGTLNLEDYAAHIESVLDRLQDPAERLCAGCASLEDIPLADHRRLITRFRAISLNHYRYACNCRCCYCEFWKRHEPTFDVLPMLRDLHARHVLADDCFISWGGGEPSILAELDEASQWLMQMGLYQHFHTNALRWSPAISRVLAANAGAINISLDAGTRRTYENVKGVDGFAAAVSTLRRYCHDARQTNAIHLKYIVFERNNDLAEVERFFELCQSLHIWKTELSLNFQEVNGGTVSEQTLLAAAYFLQEAARRKLECKTFFLQPVWVEAIARLRREHFGDRIVNGA